MGRDLVSRPSGATAPAATGLPGAWPEHRLLDALRGLPVGEEEQAALQDYVTMARGTMAPATIRILVAQLRAFGRYCMANSLPGPLPAAPRSVAAYVEHRAPDLKPASMASLVWAIGRWHGMAGLPDPCRPDRVRLAVTRHRRLAGVRQRQAAGLGAETLMRISAQLNLPERRTLRERRDAALLALGYSTGFRPGELAALQVEDLERDRDGGLLVLRRRSKTDQEGRGHLVAAPAEVAELVIAWLEGARISAGPVFRGFWPRGDEVRQTALSAQSVYRIVRDRAAAAGLSGASGHSLRVGAAQDSAELGSLALQQHFGWRSAAMPARYTERQDARTSPVAQAVAQRLKGLR